MRELLDLAGLFLTALLAATVLPAQSEFFLAGLHLTGRHDQLVLVAVATGGNVLGSMVNWVLGRYLTRFQNRPWFPVKGPALDRAAHFYRRWGLWTLLLAWAPVIGDPLTFAAGVLRTPLWVFVPLVAAGKLARYLGIVAVI
jgi:membrane protein YqaA with SNARE-associated domain